VKNRRTFGPYPGGSPEGIPTAQASYEDGYNSGLTWDRFAPHNKYVPGGPWIHSWSQRYEFSHRDPVDKAHLKAYCDATVENHAEWMRGWHDGRAAKAPTPPDLFVDHIAALGYN
jgi:hypothetical protein